MRHRKIFPFSLEEKVKTTNNSAILALKLHNLKWVVENVFLDQFLASLSCRKLWQNSDVCHSTKFVKTLERKKLLKEQAEQTSVFAFEPPWSVLSRLCFVRNLPSLPPLRSGVTQENRKNNKNVYNLSVVCDTFSCRKDRVTRCYAKHINASYSPSMANKPLSFQTSRMPLNLKTSSGKRDWCWSLRTTYTLFLYLCIDVWHTNYPQNNKIQMNRELNLYLYRHGILPCLNWTIIRDILAWTSTLSLPVIPPQIFVCFCSIKCRTLIHQTSDELGNIFFAKNEAKRKEIHRRVCKNWLQHSDVNLELEILSVFPDVWSRRFVWNLQV